MPTSPNHPVERTAHGVRLLAVPCVCSCGPPLTGSVALCLLSFAIRPKGAILCSGPFLTLPYSILGITRIAHRLRDPDQ
jgi:hypothetical protein